MNGADFIGLIRALQAHLIRPLHSQGHGLLLSLSVANCVRREPAFFKDFKSTRQSWAFVITPSSRLKSPEMRTEEFPQWACNTDEIERRSVLDSGEEEHLEG